MAIFSHNAILSIFTDVIKEANRVYYHQYIISHINYWEKNSHG